MNDNLNKGRAFEELFFGPLPPQARVFFHKNRVNATLSHVFYKQPAGWNPIDPPTPAAKRLYLAVVDSLKSAGSVTPVKMCVAVDTALDFHYHCDGFFWAGGRKFKSRVCVGFDLTTQTNWSMLNRKIHNILNGPLKVILISEKFLMDEGGFELYGRKIAEAILEGQRARVVRKEWIKECAKLGRTLSHV